MADAPKNDLKEKLEKLRHEGEERAAQRIAAKTGLTYVDLANIPISLDAVKIIDENQARDAKVASIEVQLKKIALAVENPDLPATKSLIAELGKSYELKIVI